jgi:hypothetical protein
MIPNHVRIDFLGLVFIKSSGYVRLPNGGA